MQKKKGESKKQKRWMKKRKNIHKTVHVVWRRQGWAEMTCGDSGRGPAGVVKGVRVHVFGGRRVMHDQICM